MNSSIKRYLDANIEKTVKHITEDSGNLLGLPFPYTTPCAEEDFQELYYWDTYFTNVGLLLLGKTELVKNNIENMFYLIEKYGFMPNGNRTFYLNRSQPPFLSEMVKDLFNVTKDKQWLSHAYGVLKKEYDFWQGKRVTTTGLNGYINHELFSNVLEKNYPYFYRRLGYTAKENPTREDLLDAYYGGVSCYESGWDCSSRFMDKGDEFDMIDLNSLLYGMEENMRRFSEILGTGEEKEWESRKNARREKSALLWNARRGLFMDRNFKTGEFSPYASVASFYPMYVNMATKEQAEKTVLLFDDLNLEYGISAGESKGSNGCQWDYPNVWAPMQFIMYRALKNYGYDDLALIVARKNIKLVEGCFEKTENLWEKYNGLTGEIACSDYKAPKMIGWTAGVYIFFNHELGLI
ncbi:MAG: alpha,alpha-trehalase [Clostridia bacterium]|nr:alpha,alpha-trehalase [Clostridia bacterium]